MRKVRKEIKNDVSSLLMCTTLGIGMANLGMATHAYTEKEKLNKRIDKEKLEYYEEITKLNDSLIRQQVDELNSSDKNEKLKRELYSDIVSIPDKFTYNVFAAAQTNSDTRKYHVTTESDLKEIKELSIDVTNTPMPLFLYYCTNLEDFTLSTYIQSETKLNTIPKLNSVKKFTLDTELEYFKKETLEEIFTSMPFIEDLTIKNMAVFEPGILESLKQLKKLEIYPVTNCDINFKELDHLEELKINSDEPYDIAIWLNKEEYDYLKKQGVKIIFKDGIKEEYLKIANKLDEIINNLNINENSTDDEILTEVLKYATTHYHYDEDVSESLRTGAPRKEGKESSSFYKGGWLYGTLERDSQICGNYASFVEAMYDRLYEPEKSYMLLSNNHAWNAINFDGKRYYVDSTWFDGKEYQYGEEILNSEEVLEKDLGRFAHWYKEDPDSNFVKSQEENDTKESHIAGNKLEYAENGFIKQDLKITQPVTTQEIKITTTTPKITIKTETVDTFRFDIERIKMGRMYDKEIKDYIKKAILFLSLSVLIRIKKAMRNKKEEKQLKKEMK